MIRCKRLAVLAAVIVLCVAAAAVGQRAVEPPLGPALRKGGRAGSESPVTQGFSELVTVSKNGDAVWLYSFATGVWHKQAIPENEGPVSPIIGRGVVVFRTRTRAYGCSSETGVWDSVELGEERGQPTVGINVAAFRAGNKLYAFSSKTGKWDSAELAEGETRHPTVGTIALLEAGTKIYAFSPNAGKWAVVDLDNP